MSQVGQVGRPAVQQEGGIAAPRVATEAPAELRGARPSSGRRALRVVLGIFTLGISEGVLALVRHAREGQVPQPRVAAAGLPAAPPRADVFNKEIADGLYGNTLPPTFQAAVGEAIEHLRNRFGAGHVPPDASLATLPKGKELCNALGVALKRMTEEISPQVLRAQVEERGVQLIARPPAVRKSDMTQAAPSCFPPLFWIKIPVCSKSFNPVPILKTWSACWMLICLSSGAISN